MRKLWAIFMLCLVPLGAMAQDETVVRSPVLVIDPDQVFERSKFGQTVLQQITRERQLFLEENAALIEALDAEEAELTEQRKTMDPAAFKVLADAFDRRAQDIRVARDAKQQDLDQQLDRARTGFINVAVPFINQMMNERRAAVVLRKDNVFASLNAIDITDQVIVMMDADFDARIAAQSQAAEDTAEDTLEAPVGTDAQTPETTGNE